MIALAEVPGGGDGAGEEGGAEAAVQAWFARAAAWLNDGPNGPPGSLSCVVLAPASCAASVEPAIGALRYGCVALNAPTVFGYMAAAQGATWGAHPDEPHATSGCGVVGNQYGLAGVVKTVVRGPPLATKPTIVLDAPPPALLLDALHAALTARSTGAALGRTARLLARRFLEWALARVAGPADRAYGAAC